MYLNKAIVYGNLTRDPEIKALPSGIQVASFSIATNRVYKDKNGARQEQSEFHNVVVFGRQAETAAQYLKKGATALVEGRMQTRSWDSEGVKKYRTEIIADRIQFGPRAGGPGGAAGGAATSAAGGSEGYSSGSPKASSKKAEAAAPVSGSADTIDYPEEEINPEDIPF
ncbi:MAG: single-stranded DNA-binding protein [bacterium]